jgi:two-component system response regulator (stage 0 sporulation protein F)
MSRIDRKLRPRLLVIDDAAEMRELLQEVLTERGFEVDLAADGYEGIRKLRTGHYDLVLTDFSMPGITGTEIAKEVRRVNLRIPVVVLTGSALRETRRVLCALGVAQVLDKPISPSDLCNTVDTTIQDRELERREFGRLPASDPCVVASEGTEFHGRLVSLSVKGASVLLHSQPDLPRAKSFELRIDLPSGHVTFALVPKYYIQTGEGTVTIGGLFEDLSTDTEAALRTHLESA